MTTLSPREMLDRLVGFDTTSDRSNLALIDFVEGYLGALGVACVRVPNAAGDKANLYAHIGPEVEGGVILSGHTDVVPVAGQAWDTDPWVVTERDGRLYGRGTCDMKGFLALALAHVPQMLDAGLTRPIQLALSYDEEVGCAGVIPMVHEMALRLPRADDHGAEGSHRPTRGYSTSEPAPEPRPGPTGMSCSFAQLMKS